VTIEPVNTKKIGGPVAPTPGISREEYASLMRHEYAGTVADLSQETVGGFAQHRPDWLGKHWFMYGSARGTVLSPVNVVDG
jgi:hypothetical protein